MFLRKLFAPFRRWYSPRVTTYTLDGRMVVFQRPAVRPDHYEIKTDTGQKEVVCQNDLYHTLGRRLEQLIPFCKVDGPWCYPDKVAASWRGHVITRLRLDPSYTTGHRFQIETEDDHRATLIADERILFARKIG